MLPSSSDHEWGLLFVTAIVMKRQLFINVGKLMSTSHEDSIDSIAGVN